MAEFEVLDLSGDGAQRAEIADATIALSNAVLGLGVALAGAPAIREAMDREIEVSPLLAALMDAEDPPGAGVDEDPRRPPEDGEGWACPTGLPDAECKALHDHYPTPRPDRRRGHGEG